MKIVPDYIVKELIRLLPVLIDNIELDSKSTRVQNAVRQVKVLLKKLSKVVDYGRESENNSKELHSTE